MCLSWFDCLRPPFSVHGAQDFTAPDAQDPLCRFAMLENLSSVVFVKHSVKRPVQGSDLAHKIIGGLSGADRLIKQSFSIALHGTSMPVAISR
jgi:hypothetical protein